MDAFHTLDAPIFANAAAHPSKIAVIDGTTHVDYAQLIAHASAVAHALDARGVLPGSLVGVCMHRSWTLVATLLGVLRAGCAYVPLDPAYPAERVRYMLQHSRAAAAFVDDDATAALCAGVGQCIRHDALGQRDGFSAERVREASGADLAYVIYTSGSTGRPKGVAVEHRAVLGMVRSMRLLFDDQELSGMFAGASVCFDTSVMELFGTLALGGTVVLGRNALDLPTLPAADRIRTCVMVPSSMQALLASHALPAGIRCVVFGGEALKRSLVDRIHALDPAPRVVNAYGPTEDAVYSTTCEVRVGTGPVPIGTSVRGSRAWILDEAMRPLPTGEAGELYLAGDKLARGYLHDDALTRERFVEREPDEALPENRLYRTGDLCRRNGAGEIEFLGRVDQQVKVRGYRIELGEIESTLERMPGVDAAAAAAVEGGIGQALLAAYVVSRDGSATESAVKRFLSQHLPQYMVPQVVMRLDDLPRLPNDKLDRARLPGLDAQRAVSEDSAADATGACALDSGAHDALLALVREELAGLLHIADASRIPAQSSFGSLGLDSLTTLEFCGRLGKRIGRSIAAETLAEHRTPSALVAALLQRVDSQSPGRDGAGSPTRHVAHDSLAVLQAHLQSSHPTFQAAKAPAWCATDKARFVREVMRMVNDQRRNPYGKVLRTGSATRGTVADAYNDESQDAIIWTTNLYLGLNRDSDVIAQARDALERYGTGMGTSAAASGMTDQHLAFEREFAELVGKPAACLFPTGYTANVGAVAGLLGRHDVVVIDQLCHASIVDGARLCGATVRSFRHNDAADLDAVLASECSPYRTALVVLEGVYSMGEGAAPVAEIVRTAKRHGALVLVDEAHSFGFYGPRGAGICAAQGVTGQVDFIMTTLSKALGSLGGVVAASEAHVDLLKSSARAYIFQASISPADTAAALTALRRIGSDDSLRERLWDTTRYMRQRFVDAGYDLGTGDGPIVTPHFADKDKLYALVQALYRRGIQTSAVTYPIVEPGRGRLRLICSAAHTREDVDRTVEALIEAEREVDRQLTDARSEGRPPQDAGARLRAWAGDFAAHLQAQMAHAPKAIPDLAIAITASGHDAPVSLVLRDGAIDTRPGHIDGLPACTLRFNDDSALAALQAADVQTLLHAVCTGHCTLDGQAEPFVWLIGRMVQRREGCVAA
ncbi:MAG: amino acid adenylation domain-containing protein [Xanthomonadaceae bacterium]|nr:amino acid adenylation domain-containing protein [Xanthomonadaceae bacterium]